MLRTIHKICAIRRLLATNSSPPSSSKGNSSLLSMTQKRFRNSGIEYKSGALKPKPQESRIAPLLVVCAVLPGLFIGAQISKSVANFLEENDLFVPDDDDEDD